MKNTRFSRLAILALAFAIAVCAFAGVMASAEDAAPTAEIETANVAYNEMVQLAFTVSSANLPEGAVLGIMTWAQDAGEFTAATAAYSTFEASEKDGTTYYKTAGIPAPEMDTPIYVAAAYKVGDAVTIAETPFKYSALQYAGTRLTEADVSAKQAALYEDLIKYGIKADVLFKNAENYAFVKAVNGTIGSAGAEIGGWAGKTVLLRAEAKNADGEYFIEWQNAAGESVSAKRLAYVTAPEAGIDTYTAVFGDAASSAYANTYDFEALNNGKIDLPYPSLLSEPSATAYNTTYYSKCWVSTKTLGNLTTTYSMAPLTETVDGTKTLVKDANGFYSVAAIDSYYITESLSGDKELFIDRVTAPQGYLNKFINAADSGVYQSVEFDLTNKTLTRYSIFTSYGIVIADSNGKEVNLRVNLDANAETKLLSFCDQKATNEENKNRSYYGKAIDYVEDVTLTIKSVINVTDGTLEIYTDGEYLGALPLSGWGTYAAAADTFVLDENVTVKSISINCESGSGNDVSFDNVTFLAN